MIFTASRTTAARVADFAEQLDTIEIGRMARHLAAAGLELIEDDRAALEALRSAPWVPGLPVCYGEPGTAEARAFDPAIVDRLGGQAMAAARAGAA